MSDAIWTDLHKLYKDQDWIDKPSQFAETAITYFPKTGKVLDLGAGQGQDSRFFASHGYDVLSTDLEATALEQSKAKLPAELKPKVTFQNVDLREELPFKSERFDVVYAHLSLHYFAKDQTMRLFMDIHRVLKPGGVLAFLVNSTTDPEYNTGEKIEDDYFKIDKTAKRYFSVASTREYVRYFETNLLDDHGETYKDTAKGVQNLIRYVGTKPLESLKYTSAVACVGAIIERTHGSEKEVLMQTRWRLSEQSIYNGTLEFPIGKLDQPYENIFDTLAREIREESGLTLKEIKNVSRTPVMTPNRDDAVFGFRPFCCTQQLKDGKPWVSYIFVCEVEDGEPTAQLSESKDAQWMKLRDVKSIFEQTPEKLFGLQLPAWQYYFDELS
jgi:SAM-dependent methyltransferase